jgi:hypothetical protein
MNETKNKPDQVRGIIAQGKLFDTKQSVFKYESGSNKIILFGGEETRKQYPEMALYSTTGKNPFEGANGQTLGLKLYSYGPDFAPFDYAGPDNDYAPLIALTKILNQTKVTITLGSDQIRSFIAIEAHDPLPTILGYRKVGSGVSPANVPVASVMAPQGSIESERNIIRLPLNVNDGATFKIEGEMKNGVTPGTVLANHLLVCRLFVIEDKSVNK